MPSGKLSSVLAAFETTIQKNHEHSVSDESHVKSNISERRTRMRRRRQPGEQAFSPESEKTSAAKRPTSNHVHHTGASESKLGETSRKGRSPRRNRPGYAVESNDKAPLSPVRTSRGNKIDGAYCSPTEETTDTSSAGVLFEISPSTGSKMQKLPSSLKREHSGEALIAAAQKAVTKFSPIKMGKKKMHGSLPIMGNLNNCDFSFSSLPVLLPKTGSPHRSEVQSSQTTSLNLSIATKTAFGTKSYPKSPIPQKGKLKSLKDFANDPEVNSDEASVPSINTYDPSRNSVKPSPRSPISSPNNVHHEDYHQCEYTDPLTLLSRPRPTSILLSKHHPVNRIRRVKFLDQQPGGGRRMGLENQYSKDSTPSRPRRASVTIQNEDGGNNTKLAATKIQASFRGFSQWIKTRPELLERKLRRIEREHQNELRNITERKWLEMDALRNEAMEEQKRLDSQVELGNKLIERLKRDSAMVRIQTKKLREHCKSLRQNNAHCEHMAQMQKESMTTLNGSLDQLQQQHDHFKELENHLADKAMKMAQKLSLLSRKIKHEFCCKKSLKTTTKQLVSALRERSRDDVLLDLISKMSQGDNPDEQTQPDFDKSLCLESKNAAAGNMLIAVPSFDERSIVSDLTEYGGGVVAKAARSICSGGNSFAEYDPSLISPTLPVMPLIAEE